MRSGLRWITVVLSLVTTMAWSTTVAGVTITADLDGRAISPAWAGEYYCHDLDFPRIHCFRTQSALDTAVSALGIGPLAFQPQTSGVTYVRIFVDEGFSGASAYLSQDYTNLGTIGWNDKITSFIVVNSQSGRFYTDSYYTGTNYFFCCNSWVANVGETFNDKFSSVRNLT